MAEEIKDLEKEQSPEVMEDSLSKTEVLLEENKDLISKVIIGIVILVTGYFVYNNWVAEPAEMAANEEIWPAQKLFEQDSIAKAISEFEFIAEEHSGTDAGNLANLYLGLSLLKEAKFDDALAAFESFDAKGKMMPGLKIGLIGDCHSELGNVDEAIANYKKAATVLDSKSVSPYFLKKAGVLLEQNNDVAGAVEVYQLALEKYLKEAAPSVQSVKNEMTKLLARAKAKAN